MKPKAIRELKDLTPDPHNANVGTERGRGMLEHSLRTYGAGRSILADKHGVVIAGNKTLEVAAHLGFVYTGVDLRPEQVAANEEQAARIVPQNLPRWIVGDSRNIGTLAPGLYDLIFSCPPYFDLEIYSDDEHDLSNAGDYADFLANYRAIIMQCVSLLKPNRFACFVVGDIRNKQGFYRNFVGDTVTAFLDAGMLLYNEAVLVTALGSLPIRVGKQFGSYRKLGKTHQQCLIFYRGDVKAIPAEFGEVEVADMAAAFGEVVP